MATQAELNQAILDDAAAGIARASNDQGSVELLSIEDRIKARDAAAQGDAASKPHRGLRITKLNSPGTV
jgi:hypothetical protein